MSVYYNRGLCDVPDLMIANNPKPIFLENVNRYLGTKVSENIDHHVFMTYY